MRYESSSSISISEKSSESCDVSADMVTLRLPNERIVERSCEASRSGRRGARSRTGVARAGRRALSCGSSGGRVGTESGWVAATSNGARVCARAGRHARWFKISGKQSSFYLLLSDSKNARRSSVFPVTNFAKYQYVTASERGRSLMDFENERELTGEDRAWIASAARICAQSKTQQDTVNNFRNVKRLCRAPSFILFRVEGWGFGVWGLGSRCVEY